MITFPDVSNYQAGLSLAGAPACIAKATEGTGFVDHTYAGFRDQAHAKGIPFAGYHYLHHGDINAQASLAFSMVGPGTPLMLDVEVVQNDADPTFGDMVTFAQVYRAMGGTVTLLYLPQWFWSGHWGSPDLTPLAKAGLSLISSNYTDLSTGAGWHPYGGVTPAIWQYTSSQPFNGMRVDFNAYQGTVEQLRALFNGSTGDDMALTPEERNIVDATDRRVAAALVTGQAVIDDVPGYGSGTKVWAVDKLNGIDDKLGKLSTGGVDVDALVAALVPALAASPDFIKALTEAAFQGAQRAESE